MALVQVVGPSDSHSVSDQHVSYCPHCSFAKDKLRAEITLNLNEAPPLLPPASTFTSCLL